MIAGDTTPLLITGGAGFIGCNLADRLAQEDENVLIYDSLARPGVEENLAWLRRRHPRRISVAIADVQDQAGVREAIASAAAVFHFAAQVAVTTSMQDPHHDLRVNLLGTFNVMEALRRRPLPCVFASTNKVYGELVGRDFVCTEQAYVPREAGCWHGIDERQTLDFRTPYGCSKGAADQYVLDYARNFGVPAAVMRMSCIFGPRQFGTEDQGWVAHFLLRAMAGEAITIYGDGRQVRDVLYVDDAVQAYVAAWRNIGRVAGQAFNLGGGPTNAVSLVQVIREIERLLDRQIELRFAPWRTNDQRYYVSDTRRVRAALDLPDPTDWRVGIESLLRHFEDFGRGAPTGSTPHLAGVASA